MLVQDDNLNTHAPASLYEAFPPQEARRLVERFEGHYTPKHGSWLNMAESELGVLAPNASTGSPTAPRLKPRSQPGSSGATDRARGDHAPTAVGEAPVDIACAGASAHLRKRRP